jgi:hypothetical protein
VAARYDAADGRLLSVQANERRGAVWTDLVLLDREALLARLQPRRLVYAGAVDPDVPRDFMVRGRLSLQDAGGRRAHLTLGEYPAGRDDLGVAVF